MQKISHCPLHKTIGIFIPIFLLLYFWLPPIAIGNYLSFKFQITDLLLPFILYYLLIRPNVWQESKRAVFIGSSIAIYIAFTILINPGAHTLNNFFECYDVLKLTCYFLFIKCYFRVEKINLWVDIACLFLLVFNVFHFFNIFDFNHTIMPIYSDSENTYLLFFGVDPWGAPWAKRMIGTMSNPNLNAILFLFFFIWYAPCPQWGWKKALFFLLVTSAILLCQSRSGIIICIILFIINYFFAKIPYRELLIQLGSIAAFIGIGFLGYHLMNINKEPSNKYNSPIGYVLTLTHTDLRDDPSLNQRFATWHNMIQEIKERPLFGHSPNKQVLSIQKIYPDNEYISISYKYGLIGLLLYLLFFTLPIIHTLKEARQSQEAKMLLLCSLLFAMAAITSEPIQNHRTALLYIIMLALFYGKRTSYHLEMKHNNN